jgi:hypothetical protein
MKKIYKDIIYIDKCWYQEQKEIPVCYTGIYRPVSNTEVDRQKCEK